MVRYLSLLLFIGFVFSVSNAQEWQPSFVAGNLDVNGSFIGGSEILHLVTHKD